MRVLANGLLFSISLLISLGIGEVMVRIFKPQVPPGYFDQRYLIDGKPSVDAGYYFPDSILPVALEPYFDHMVADLAWYPKPYHVSLDAWGYRNNSDAHRLASVAVVGDSATFGVGVNREHTFVAELGRLMRDPVYNLSIPGAGPESYMVMLDNYLKSAYPLSLIIVVYYAGNDSGNLSYSIWRELSSCQPPASKIDRADISPILFQYPIWYKTSFIKCSHLTNFLRELSP